MNSVLKMNFLLNIDPYTIPVINIKNRYFNTLVKNWDHTIFLSLSILFPYISTHMLQSIFTLTIIKAQEKIKNFQNIFVKKINFILECSSQ